MKNGNKRKKGVLNDGISGFKNKKAIFGLLD